MRGSHLAKKRRKKKIKIILVTLLLVIILLVINNFRSLNNPTEGVINNSSGRNVLNNKKSKPVTKIEVSGEYISFEYLDSFRQTPSGPLVPPQLETFNFVTKSVPFWELSIGVRQLASGKLADDGSYNLRTTNTETFKKEQLLINDEWVTIFSDTRGDYSKVGFIQHNNMLLSVALTGSGDKDKMQKHLKDILSSIEWK